MKRWRLGSEGRERLEHRALAGAPNANNQKLKIGAERIGIAAAEIRRNVKGCWNLGSCGMGCPTNAKQSMLVTTIPGRAGPWRRCWCRRGAAVPGTGRWARAGRALRNRGRQRHAQSPVPGTRVTARTSCWPVAPSIHRPC
jgi:hypothetical protein